MTDERDNVPLDPVAALYEDAVDRLRKAQAATVVAKNALAACKTEEAEAKRLVDTLTQARKDRIVELAHDPDLKFRELGERFKLSESQVSRMVSSAEKPPPRRSRVNRQAD